MGSSWIRAQTRVPFIGRWILNRCATREVSPDIIFKQKGCVLCKLFVLDYMESCFYTFPKCTKSVNCTKQEEMDFIILLNITGNRTVQKKNAPTSSPSPIAHFYHITNRLELRIAEYTSGEKSHQTDRHYKKPLNEDFYIRLH